MPIRRMAALVRDEIFTAVLDSLLDCLAFFELCDDETLHPDDAVRQMETVAWRLGRLTTAQREEQARLIRDRAETWADAPGRRESPVETPVGLGLIDGESTI